MPTITTAASVGTRARPATTTTTTAAASVGTHAHLALLDSGYCSQGGGDTHG